MILREAYAGIPAVGVCRQNGIAGNMFYRWKKKHGGMGVPELRRMKELEAENSRLKRIYSDLSLENDASCASTEPVGRRSRTHTCSRGLEKVMEITTSGWRATTSGFLMTL